MSGLRLGVVASGRGSNLQAVIDARAAGALDVDLRLVVSNRPGAQALVRATVADIPTAVVSHVGLKRPVFDRQLADVLKAAEVDWILFAGFMRIVTPTFLDSFPNRVINIHPSLLPAFPGVDAQAQALAYGAAVTGCTVHLVDDGVDTGPVLAQRALDVAPSATREHLASRLLSVEHQLLVATLQRIATEGFRVVEGEPRRRVQWLGAEPLVSTVPSESEQHA